MRKIKAWGNFQIVETPDEYANLKDLKGDCYCPETNSDISKAVLRRQELKFEKQIEELGVYGYILEKWDPEIDKGWTYVDSCYGFVGQYDPKIDQFNHYIIEELDNISKEF